MLKKVRMRLTLLCAGITATIMVVMSLCYLYVSEQNLHENRLQAFKNDMNTITTNLEQQSVISMEWLAKMEASGDYRFYVLDKGVPFLYNRLDEQDGLPDTLVQNILALYAASENVLRQSHAAYHVEYEFSSDGEMYLGGVIRMGIPRQTLEVIVLSPMAALEEQINRQRFKFLLINCAAVLALSAFSYVFTGILLRPIIESRQKQNAFIASASHELRTPLAVILSAAECCQTASPDRRDSFFATIAGEGQRMSDLIDEMLVLSQSDSKQMMVSMQETELDTFLISTYEAFEPLAEKKNIAVSLKLPQGAIPRCMTDPERLRQVLEVLLHNAISYTPEQGDIILSLKYVPLKLTPGRGHFFISVQDNGIGISDADKARIFDRFYRVEKSRSDKGHYGLGLSVAYEIMKALGGTISVSDAEGGGSVFTVSL